MNNSTSQCGASDGLEHLQRPYGLPLTIAIDSSTRDASIALASGDQIIHYISLDRNSRTAATISVALSELLNLARGIEQPIGSIAVTDGPGSFTGLRIGVTTAKTLAYALNCKIIAVDSLACMAMSLFASNQDAINATVALNAYRGQLFTATWTRDQWDHACDVTGDFTTQSRVIEESEWIESLKTADVNHLFGAESTVAQKSKVECIITSEPNAKDVAYLASIIARRGVFVSPMHLLPRYLRESAAEEKLRST